MQLTIAIPTYNRAHLLKETLAVLLPQLQADVEVLVCDNHSADGTTAYLESKHPEIRVVRQEKNLGLDGNLLSCLEHARGKYVWLLSDDDFPASDAVDAVLKVTRSRPETAMFYLRTRFSDVRISDYDGAPSQTTWSTRDKDALLEDVGPVITFISSVVARRDLVDVAFIRKWTGSLLTPAALALQMGAAGPVLVSDRCLVVARGGNSGGYDAYSVFTVGLRRLLRDARRFGYSGRALNKTFEQTLAADARLARWTVQQVEALWRDATITAT